MNYPIRILHMIAKLELGGSQSMIMNLYRNIDRNKIQFDFIVDHSDESDLRNEIISMGGKVYDFPTFKGWNIIRIIKTWNNFFRSHKEYKVLHTHSRSYASIYLKIAKKRGLVTISHSHSTSNGTGMKALIKKIMQFPIRFQATYLFACSNEAGKWLFGKKTVNNPNYRVFPNAIDSSLFKYDSKVRDKVRKQLGLDGTFVIGHVGRMSEPKNHKFLLQIFKKYQKINSNSKLLLIGDGELYSEIDNLIHKLDLSDKIIVLGAKKNTYDFYQAMDCFIFPSMWEGLGIAVIEAQVSGLKCLVSDTVPTKVDIGAGLVKFFPLSKSPEEWSQQIVASCRGDNTKYVIDLGYDIRDNASKLQSFYEELFK